MGEKSAHINWKSTLKENGFFFLLILSLFVGQGISYGHLCLFHFTIPLYFLNELRTGLKWKLLFEKNALPIHLFYLIVFGISLLHPLNYSYLYFYGLSYLIFSLLWIKKDFIVANYRLILFFFLGLFILDLNIAFLEFLTSFRYPISRLSTINHWFGREYNFFASGTECFDWNYVLSSPTGLHWNQNNLAFVLIIFFSFTFLIKNGWLKNILRTIVIILVVSAGARLGFYALILLYFILWISEWRLKKWQQLLPILTFIFILTDGFYILPTQMKKVKEVAVISKSEFTDRFPEYCYEKLSSGETRRQLMVEGKELISENLILGNGAGGFTQRMNDLNQMRNNKDQLVINAHNFLIELLVDFGIFILLPIILILFTIFKNLKKKTWENWILFITASISIIAGSVMISSLVYFLPFYLFFFLIYINLSSEKGSLYLD
jgi:hypothetical protein